eukprot:1023856_1
MAHFSYSTYLLSNTTQTSLRANPSQHISVVGHMKGMDVVYIVIGGIVSVCLFCCILLLCIKYRKSASATEQDAAYATSKPSSVEIVNGVELHYKYTSKGTIYNPDQHGTSFAKEETVDRLMKDQKTTVHRNPVHSPRAVHTANQTVVRLPSPRTVHNHEPNVYTQSPRVNHTQSPRAMNPVATNQTHGSPRAATRADQLVIRIPRLRRTDTQPKKRNPVHTIHNQSPRQVNNHTQTPMSAMHKPIPHRQAFSNDQYPKRNEYDQTGRDMTRGDTELTDVSLSTVNTKYADSARSIGAQTYAIVDTITNIINTANHDQKQTKHVLSLNKLNIDIAHSIGGSSVGLNREPSIQTTTLNMEPSMSMHTPTDTEYYD